MAFSLISRHVKRHGRSETFSALLSTTSYSSSSTIAKKIPSRPSSPSLIPKKSKGIEMSELDGFLPPIQRTNEITDMFSKLKIDGEQKMQQKSEEESSFEVPLESFDKLLKSTWLVNRLEELSICSPTQIQSLILRKLDDDKDLMIKAHTGTGKSFGYILALLDNLRPLPKNPTFTWQSPNLVIVPNSMIANQLISWTENLLKKRNVQLDSVVRVILGDKDSINNSDLMKPGVSHILIATPKGIQTKLSQGLVNLQSIRTIILDEADFLLKPLKKHATAKEKANRAKHPVATMTVLSEIRDFVENKDLSRPKMLALSATLTSRTRKILKSYGFLDKNSFFLEDVQQKKIGCPSQIQHFHRVLSSSNNIDELTNLINSIVQEKDDKLGLLFLPAAQSKTEIQSFLMANNIKTKLISMCSNDFEQTTLLIASDVDARGLDIPELDYVILAGAPTSSDSYLHMAGRVGRMGKDGQVYTLIDNSKDFERHLGYISRLSLRSSVYLPDDA